jgi:oxygen-independent coproporphyrinogen-3 oxidase|tara:strand:+ start:9728 stop:11128 length:1401 start_codon:yes stop_codon:yes gene_type:complete
MNIARLNSPSLVAATHCLSKYDSPGPRYTSYPTANLFRQDIGQQQYLDLASNEHLSIAPLSLYVHIPFCKNICYYCGCNKVVTKQSDAGRKYLDMLAIELKARGALHGHRPVSQMHWGGGTPTFLDDGELTELMHLIACHFNLDDGINREYSIEIDPRAVEESTIALLKGIGFNRISMGIQDFDPFVQQAINREQSYDLVKQLSDSIRDHDFSSLSFDLIYGLPEQSVTSFNDTLDKVITLNPDRISCYSYAHLPKRFPSQRSIDRLTLPSSDQKLAIFEMTIARLTAAGYQYIGMDHFVKPDDELAQARKNRRLQRNFQGYSTSLAADLIGVGPSSISQFAGSYFQNEKNLDDYYNALNNQRLPVSQGFTMSEEDRLRNFVIMNIACQLSINFEEVKQKFDIDFQQHFASSIKQLQPFIDDGLATISQSEISISEQGQLVLRNICMLFDEYLSTNPNENSFSRTI